MDYYEMNMVHIKPYSESLYNALIEVNISDTSNHLENINLIDTKNGSKAIVIRTDLAQFRLNSIYNPQEEAKKWVDQFDFKNLHTVISMFGFGNGVFAREILARMGEEDVLLVYEPSAELFLYVLHHFDLTDIFSNNKIILAIEKINEFDFHHVL